MESSSHPITSGLADIAAAWRRFWFTPSPPHLLGLLRILNGSMLCYTHAVWGLGLLDFLGPQAWIQRNTAALLNTMPGGANHTFSIFYHVDEPWLLWLIHVIAMMVFMLYTLGLFTRVTAVLAWLFTLNYCHRLIGLQYGLDQINAYMAMYLMLAPCGAVYSVDHWLAGRSGKSPPVASSVATTVATRLFQLHLCIIYFFGGVSKMRGETWWDGSAVWFAIANLEYQSLNVTWLISMRWLVALLSHVTVLWETFYCVLVWPRATRPVMLALAVCVHGFIGSCLGMITFGSIMIAANLIFIPPEYVQSLVEKLMHGGKDKMDGI